MYRVYTTNRALLFESAKEESEIHLLGDGRCDSPGYNAKYRTYTLMDSQSGHILDFHISHVRVAGNSKGWNWIVSKGRSIVCSSMVSKLAVL